MSHHCRSHYARRMENENAQNQTQLQSQDQDADQESRVILRGIGNNDVNITIDNVSVAVAILASFGLLTGALDGDTLRTYLDRLTAKQ